LVNGTLEDAIDVLSKRSVDIRSLGAPRLSRTYFDKTALFGELGQNIAKGWGELDPAAKDALIGAGIGAGVGGIASGFEDDEDERSTFGSMLRGGLAGGAVGGGIGLMKKYWGRQVGPLDTPDPDALGKNEFWMPIKDAQGNMVEKGRKVTWNEEGINAAAKKRGIPAEAIKDEIAKQMESLKGADSDWSGTVNGWIGDGLMSFDKGGLAAGGAVAGVDAGYEHLRKRDFERAMPTTHTRGDVPQFRKSLLEKLKDGEREMRAPTELRDIEQTTASGTISRVPKNVVTGPEELIEYFKNSDQLPSEWKKVLRSDELSRLASEGRIEELIVAAGRNNLPVIAGSSPGELAAHLGVVNDMSTQRAVATAGTHGPNALPSFHGETGRPWFDRHGSKNPLKWRGGLGQAERLRPSNYRFGQHSLLGPGQMVPKLGLRTGGKYLRKGLLPYLAYHAFKSKRTSTDRLQEAMKSLEQYMKPVDGGGGAPPATSDAPVAEGAREAVLGSTSGTF
jgi:hypothetical protein